MARTRNIKPAFFTSDKLAECDPLARLLFVGLWTIADREGRLEDRPRRIKAQILPFDDCDVDVLLNQLATHGFIRRYRVVDQPIIQVTTFTRHQNPHPKEPQSALPVAENAMPCKDSDEPRKSMDESRNDWNEPSLLSLYPYPSNLYPSNPSPKMLVVDAPAARPVAETEGQLAAADFVLRLHDQEFKLFVRSIEDLIRRENEYRPTNRFTWTPTAATMEADLRGLIYRQKDKTKIELLYAAYNALKEKLNWPEYVRLVITYTIRASKKQRVREPFKFAMTMLLRPGEIASAKGDGILSNKWMG